MTGFVGGALVLGSVIALVTATLLWSRARKELGWESVLGTINAAEVRFRGEDYEPRIEYTYSYQGRAFRGAKVRSLLVYANWRGPAKAVVRKYPVGSVVTVFVNPENPAECVLERGGDPWFLPVMLSCSAFLLATGLAFLNKH